MFTVKNSNTVDSKNNNNDINLNKNNNNNKKIKTQDNAKNIRISNSNNIIEATKQHTFTPCKNCDLRPCRPIA